MIYKMFNTYILNSIHYHNSLGVQRITFFLNILSGPKNPIRKPRRRTIISLKVMGEEIYFLGLIKGIVLILLS